MDLCNEWRELFVIESCEKSVPKERSIVWVDLDPAAVKNSGETPG